MRPQTIDEVLRRKSWPGSAVLVVEAIEPSWALVFPRFDAVVSELGGELSHAAILLREAEVPSVINASGAFHGLVEGDLVRVDPTHGEVVRLGWRAKPAAGLRRSPRPRLGPGRSGRRQPAESRRGTLKVRPSGRADRRPGFGHARRRASGFSCSP